MATTNAMSRKGKWTNEEEILTARIIHYFSLGVLQLPEGTTLRAYLSQKLDCDPMRITKKFTGTNCLGKRVYHSCERTTATYEVAKQAVDELAELEARFRSKLERNKEKRTGMLGIEARLLGGRHRSLDPRAMTTATNIPPASNAMFAFGQQGSAAPAPSSMPPGTNVAAAAAAAAAAGWNPLTAQQSYAVPPPGYHLPPPPPPTHGVFGRQSPAAAAAALLSTVAAPAPPVLHSFGMSPIAARSPAPTAAGGHGHQLTAAVLRSHQVQQAAAYSQSQHFQNQAAAAAAAAAAGTPQQIPSLPPFHGSAAGGVGGNPATCSEQRASVSGSVSSATVTFGMVSSQSGMHLDMSSGGGAPVQSAQAQLPLPPPPSPQRQQQQKQSPGSPPVPAGAVQSQAYLRTVSGQIHNPYWPYQSLHGGGAGSGSKQQQAVSAAAAAAARGGYVEYGPTAAHGYHPPATPQVAGFPHLGMAHPMQQQWLHQHQRYGGGGSAGAAMAGGVGLPTWQQLLQQRQPLPKSTPSPGSTAASASAEPQGPGMGMMAWLYCGNSSSGGGGGGGGGSGSGGSQAASSSSPISSDAHDLGGLAALPPSDSQMPPPPSGGGASSADAAAVVSAEGGAASSTMASPRELQQMYKKGSALGKSARRHGKPHRGGDGRESYRTMGGMRQSGSVTGLSSGSSSSGGGAGSGSTTTADSGNTTADASSSLASLSSGSRTGSGSDEQRSNRGRGGGHKSGGGSSGGDPTVSLGSTSGSESGSEGTDKRRSPLTGDDSQTLPPSPQRMDVDGAGGLLMGFIQSLTKQHKFDQQQQQQQAQQPNHQLPRSPAHKQQQQKQQEAAEQPEQPQQQQEEQQNKHHQHHKPTPPSAPHTAPILHTFPRVRHKHAARMEKEARLAAAAGGRDLGSGSFGRTTSSSSSSSGGGRNDLISPPSAKKQRSFGDNSNSAAAAGAALLERPRKSGSDACSGSRSGRGGVVRDAVAPPPRPLPTASLLGNGVALLHPRSESRKRPREEVGAVRVPPAPTSECVGIIRGGQGARKEAVEEGNSVGGGSSSNIDDESLSSEGANSEGGGFEDSGSWGSSGKESPSLEEGNEASVSDGDYGGGDERSSSFEDRDNNDVFGEAMPPVLGGKVESRAGVGRGRGNESASAVVSARGVGICAASR